MKYNPRYNPELITEDVNKLNDLRLKNVIEDRDKRLKEITELQLYIQELEFDCEQLKIGLIIFALCIIAQAAYIFISRM
jgi:hypothetical protein